MANEWNKVKPTFWVLLGNNIMQNVYFNFMEAIAASVSLHLSKLIVLK